MSALKFDALLFDCDGVLVDSEAITHSVLCAMLNEAGWAEPHIMRLGPPRAPAKPLDRSPHRAA